MKYTLGLFLFFASANSFADSCRTIAKYDEMISTIYVVCPNLPKIPDKQAANIIDKIFASRDFEPDEYQVLFVGSLGQITDKAHTARKLIGKYYTHDNQLIIWPNDATKKRVIKFEHRVR